MVIDFRVWIGQTTDCKDIHGIRGISINVYLPSMSESLTISQKQARRLAIIHQGLHTTTPFGRGKSGVLKAIEQTGYVQIDTISVVERAHHHVLRSRVPNYKKEYLHDLQIKDRKVLEFWSHAAAFIPMSDYRFTLPIVDHFKAGKDNRPTGDKKLMRHVLDRIRNEGPLMSRSFEPASNPKGDGWWEAKPAKLALLRLFFEGEILVSHRQGFQRLFDLTERVIPSDISTTSPSKEEYADFLIDRHLKAHAFGSASMIAYLRKGMKPTVNKRLKERHAEAGLIRIEIKGMENTDLYASPDLLKSSNSRITKQLKILSPFDNSVIQRDRLSAVFGYDYLIECYVPKPKRIYGYFVLPLLLGDTFVGRLDAKADRKKKVLNIISLHLEAGVDEEAFLVKFAPAIKEFCTFNGCVRIEVLSSVHSALRDKLRGMLRGAIS